MKVVLTAKHSTVFGHCVGDCGRGFTEMPIERRTVIRGATLGPMHEREGFRETVRCQFCAERLACVCRIDHQSLSSKVPLLVLDTVDEIQYPLLILFGDRANLLDC